MVNPPHIFAKSNPRMIELAGTFFVLLMAYGIKFAEIIALDTVLFAWIGLLIYALIKVRAKVLIFVFLAYLILFVFYSLGIAAFEGSDNDLTYVKNLLSSFILTSIVIGVLSGEVRHYIHHASNNGVAKTIVFLGFLTIVIWCVFILYRTKVFGGFAVKEFGGANYLTTADLVCLFALLVIGSAVYTQKTNLIFFAITVFALILLGSRASLVVFIFSAFFCFTEMSFKQKLIMSLMFCFLSVFFILFSAGSLDEQLSYRVMTLFELGKDESRLARSSLLSEHVQLIHSDLSCLFFPCMPEQGSYVHNFISLHQYFGFMGLFFVLILLAFFLFRYRNINLPAKGMFIFCLIMFFMFRAWLALVFPVFMACLIMPYFLYSKPSQIRH